MILTLACSVTAQPALLATYKGSPAILASFEESSVASRRKRAPVAFRPRLSTGLALSLFIVHPLYAGSLEKS